MPDFVWSPKDVAIEFLDDNASRVIHGEFIALRPLDGPGGEYDPQGTFYEGTVLFPTRTAPKVTSLFSLYDVTATPIADEEIRYQLSNDGGTTWYWWSGAAWVQSIAATDWSLMADLDTNLLTFPLGTRQFRVKAKLTPSTDGKASPVLAGVLLCGELSMNFLEDVKRSFKRHLEANLLPRRTVYLNVDGATGYTFGATPVLAEPIHVYNLDDDPLRETDLFDSLIVDDDTQSQTIVFTSVQAGRLEVVYTFQPRICIATPDAEMVEVQLPNVLITFEEYPPRPLVFSGTRVTEYSPARLVSRVRPHPRNIEIGVTIVVSADLELDAVAMADLLYDIFDPERRYFVSVGTGENYAVTEVSSVRQNDAISAGIHAYTCTLMITGWRWTTGFTEYKVASTMAVRSGTFQGKLEEA